VSGKGDVSADERDNKNKKVMEVSDRLVRGTRIDAVRRHCGVKQGSAEYAAPFYPAHQRCIELKNQE
jgi:hypothetical protein